VRLPAGPAPAGGGRAAGGTRPASHGRSKFRIYRAARYPRIAMCRKTVGSSPKNHSKDDDLLRVSAPPLPGAAFLPGSKRSGRIKPGGDWWSRRDLRGWLLDRDKAPSGDRRRTTPLYAEDVEAKKDTQDTDHFRNPPGQGHGRVRRDTDAQGPRNKDPRAPGEGKGRPYWRGKKRVYPAHSPRDWRPFGPASRAPEPGP